MRPRSQTRTSLQFAIFAIGPLSVFLPAEAAAQNSPAPPLNAAMVVAGPTHRITNTIDLNGDGFADAIGYWASTTNGFVSVHTFLNDTHGNLVFAWMTDTMPGDVGTVSGTAVGDLNNDGLEDFVISIGTVTKVFQANANGSMTNILTFTEPSSALFTQAAVIADFNNDGRKDIGLLNNAITIYLNSPHAGWIRKSNTISPVGAAYAMLAMDATGDGQNDIVYAQYDRLNISTIVGGLVQSNQSYLLPYLYKSMPVAGDIDQDGDADIVSFFDTDYTVFRRTGPSTFAQEPLRTGGPATNLADIDGDGDLDGCCCGGGGGGYTQPYNTQPSIFRVSLNLGNSQFASAFEIPGIGALHLAGAVDLDHDGDVDLLAGRAAVYANGNIQAPFVLASASSGVIWPGSICDFDRDGDPDINFGLGTTMRNDGTGLFTNTQAAWPAAPAGSVFAGPGYFGDFTNDGCDDLIVSRHQGSAAGAFIEMRLLKNAGGGGLVDGGPAAMPGVDFNFPQETATNRNRPLGALTADFDSDGDLDLLVRTISAQPLGSYEFVNNLNGPSAKFFGGAFFIDQAMGLGDFNLDGRMDMVAVTPIVPGTSTGYLRIQQNQGANTFAPQPNILSDLIDGSKQTLGIQDFDDDGYLDISYLTSGLLVLMKNNQTGGFIKSFPYTAAPGLTLPFNVIGADLNNDSRMDLLSSSTGNSQMNTLIALRTPAGFALPVEQCGFAAAAVDVDGDGYADVIGTRGDNLDTKTRILLNRNYSHHSGGMRRQYGNATIGTGGFAPVLGVAGPFMPGDTLNVRMNGALGGTGVLIVVGSSESNIPDWPLAGLTSFADPWIDFVLADASGAPGTGGAGSVNIQVLVTPELIAQTYYLQGYAYDPVAPNLIVQTNGLRITLGQ